MDLSTGRSTSFILTGLKMSVGTKLIWVMFPEKLPHLPSSWQVLKCAYFIIEACPEVFVSKNKEQVLTIGVPRNRLCWSYALPCPRCFSFEGHRAHPIEC